MVATASRHDELPTAPFPAYRRQLPPPLPRPQSQHQLKIVSMPVVVPRALKKAKLLIELPLEQLDEQEIAQITTWLRGRGASSVVEVRRHVLARAAERAAERVITFGRTVRSRFFGAVQSGLVWTLSRVTHADSRELRKPPVGQHGVNDVHSDPLAGS